MEKRLNNALTLALALTLCVLASGFSNAGEQGKELKILVMPKLVGIPWFNASDVGAERAGKELGVDIIYAGPTVADAAEQVKMIEDYMNQGIDAICIAPNDPAAVSLFSTLPVITAFW